MAPRRLLLICNFFPPNPVVGAARSGSLARYLPENGWLVDVICVAAAGPAPDIVGHCVRLDVVDPVDRLVNAIRRRSSVSRPPATSKPGRSPAWRVRVARHLFYPDRVRAFIPAAVRAAKELARSTNYDAVYATGPRWSSLLAGAAVAREIRRPFVAEFRDIWAGGLYRPGGDPAARLDGWLESRVVARATAVVAVTPTAADLMGQRHPHARIFENPVGFDPELLDRRTVAKPSGPITLVHAGSLYGLRRDPTPLFRALAGLHADGRVHPNDFRVVFYGSDSHLACEAARRCGVHCFVDCRGSVSKSVAVAAQERAHALLAILYDHPEETTAIPAKIYEYLTFQRPILALGPAGNPTGELLARAPSGFYGTDADGIVRWLTRLLAKEHPDAEWDVSDLAHDRVVARMADALHTLMGSAHAHD